MDSKAVVKPAIVLLLISAIAAGILGVVSEVTAAPIAAQNEKSLNEGMQAVMPDASSFELLDADLTGTITAKAITAVSLSQQSPAVSAAL